MLLYDSVWKTVTPHNKQHITHDPLILCIYLSKAPAEYLIMFCIRFVSVSRPGQLGATSVKNAIQMEAEGFFCLFFFNILWKEKWWGKWECEACLSAYVTNAWCVWFSPIQGRSSTHSCSLSTPPPARHYVRTTEHFMHSQDVNSYHMVITTLRKKIWAYLKWLLHNVQVIT